MASVTIRLSAIKQLVYSLRRSTRGENWRMEGGIASDEVRAELNRRQGMWDALMEQRGPQAVPAALLRDLGMNGGAQGVWVDKDRTARCTDDGHGVSVGLLHTGQHYPDDMSEDGVIYHYPKTDRPATRDANEVAATKNAGRLRLPVFVITQRTHALRDVHRGWVVDCDDESSLFLISFAESPPRSQSSDGLATATIGEEEPFVAFDVTQRRLREAKDRPGQQRFKFAVFKRYGPKCGVCSVSVVNLLQAAHIIPKEDQGSDDPRNGLVLCANHHLAYDAGQFAIEPDSLTLHLKPGGPSAQALSLTVAKLSPLCELPHPDALGWRFAHWRRATT